jgi:hypothetical protein
LKETKSQTIKRILGEVGHELFEYNPITGDLMGKLSDKNNEKLANYFGKGGFSAFITRRGGKKIATESMTQGGNNYYCFNLSLKNVVYTIKNHRLAWFLYYGEWANEIDHIDGDGLNNKLSNLRSVTRSENSKNHKKKSNNTSGLAGVSFRTDRDLWRAYSNVSFPKKKQIVLGHFKDFFEACCARKAFELKNGYTERHGK